MAKATKKEFSWDKETMVKEIEVNAYEKRIVSITELKGKQYVCVATHKKIKDEWKPVKNATFPMDVWEQVCDAVTDFKLGNAFGTTTGRLQTKMENKSAEPKSEPKLQASPKANREKPAMKGKKLSIEDQLEKNENYAYLTIEQQQLLIRKVKAFVEEYGMVGIMISKTNYRTEPGVMKDKAEKELRAGKGFSRAKFTFITE